MGQLERHLEVRLLDRGPRGLTPTPAGTVTVEHARRVLAAVDELHGAVRPLVEHRNRVLRVGLFVGGVGELTAPLLEALPGRLPGLRVAATGLGTDGLVAPLLADEVDVTSGWGPLHDDRLDVRPLFREERIVVVGARHPLADAAEVTADDLLDLPPAGSLEGEPETWESWWNLVPERNGEQPARLAAPEAADQVTSCAGTPCDRRSRRCPRTSPGPSPASSSASGTRGRQPSPRPPPWWSAAAGATLSSRPSSA